MSERQDGRDTAKGGEDSNSPHYENSVNVK